MPRRAVERLACDAVEAVDRREPGSGVALRAGRTCGTRRAGSARFTFWPLDVPGEVCLGLLARGVVEDDADEPVPDVTAGVDRVRATRRGGRHRHDAEE